jgi:CubicO group peptidase (beta-lactamase class C family)
MNMQGSMALDTELHDGLAAHIARGDLPGVVWLVMRGGEIHAGVLGALRAGSPGPMRRDTLFRISSMTKPMVAAVAMMLVEDRVLGLDDSVERWIPELADRRVLRQLDAALDDTVPAKRAITVRDVLTNRMGFGIVWGPPNALPIQRAAAELELGAFGPPRPDQPPAPDEWVRRFASLPLMAQPGERWMYNTPSEVLGVLLARASGKPLDALLGERLFGPLGMKDTGFYVPKSHLGRLATSYWANPETSALELFDEADGGAWSRPPAFPSGGAGLVSTIDDAYAFAHMMLRHGKSDTRRVLSAASVEAMTTDQITEAQKVASVGALDPSFWDDCGWGIGLAVVTRPDLHGPRGFGWDGGLGTSMWWDPSTDTIGILMTQRSEYPRMSAIYRDFWATVNRSPWR